MFRLLSLTQERPGRPVIGDVLFHGLALTKRLSTIHYLKPVSLFGFQKVFTSFVVLALVIPAQANL